jgi:hypothetical protein
MKILREIRFMLCTVSFIASVLAIVVHLIGIAFKFYPVWPIPTFFISTPVFLITVLPGTLDTDEIYELRAKKKLGYTDEELMDCGFTKNQIKHYTRDLTEDSD